MNFSKPINTTAPLAITSVSRTTVVVPVLQPNSPGGVTTYTSDKTEKQFLIWTPDLKEVKTLCPTGEVLQGTLNYNFVFADQNGNSYIWRTPKEHPEILPQIHQDLLGTGFLTSGGKYRFRTIKEQINFMQKARRLNLRNTVAIYADEVGMLLPFIPGTPYDKYLRRGGITATKNVLDNIICAHKQNIVYGDRWAKNTIVQPSESIVEIDFDIELTGEIAQEFELAQLLYHILFFSNRRKTMLEFIESYLQINQIAIAQYQLSRIKEFLSNYANYFQDKPSEGISGGIKQEITELIRILSFWETSPRRGEGELPS